MRGGRWRGAVLAGALAGACPSLAWAGVGDIAAGDAEVAAAVRGEGAGSAAPERWRFLAPRLLYPGHMADLRQPRSAVRVCSSPRWHHPQLDAAVGGQWSVVQWRPEGAPDDAFEAAVYAADFQRFDLEHDTDLLGADGRWGFPFAWRRGAFAAKLELGHLSSHVGDEAILHLGRTRINYIKEEVVAGVMAEPWPWARTYLEGGYALRMGKESGRNRQRPARLQWGVELVPNEVWPRAWPVYLAADFGARQEVGWNTSVHVEGGVVLWADGGGRSLRFACSWFRGKNPVTQYFRQQVQWWSFGFVGEL